MPGESGIFASQTHLDQNQLDTAITSSLHELESWLQDKEFRRDGEGLSSICIDPGLQKMTEPLLKRLNLKSGGHYNVRRFSHPTKARAPSSGLYLIPIRVSGNATVSGKPLRVGCVTCIVQDVDITPDVDCLVLRKPKAK